MKKILLGILLLLALPAQAQTIVQCKTPGGSQGACPAGSIPNDRLVSTPPVLSSTTPAAVGSAGAVGVGTTAARSDHAHALPATGTAGTYAYPVSVTTDAQGRTSSVTAGSAPAAASRLISTSTGLQGGGDLSADRTLSIDATVATLTGAQILINKTINCASNTCTVRLGSDVTGVTLIANGGTNSSTALTGNQPMISSGGKIVEAGSCSSSQVLVGGSPPACGAVPAAANTAVDVQSISAGSATWTKPAGARLLHIISIGAGGPGGSGRNGAGTTDYGGGGGGGGGFSELWIEATQVGATVAMVGGTGGSTVAGVTAATTNGNTGSAGGDSTFGTLLRGGGGGPGGGGSTTGGTGGTAGTGQQSGGTGAAGNTGTGAGQSAVPANFGPSGGGGGGGFVSGFYSAGGTSLSPYGMALATIAGGAAGNAAAAGSAGSNGAAASTYQPSTGGGGGGGGKGGGTGGAGGTYGAGGGGGGASDTTGITSGPGGAGGHGITIVETF